ncbi:hypothetical protein DFQ28_006101 [Apophysomyces sp. BC1034]|nr:hypothetical protein DFQ28_006101 [Apophysomyces sp. BC1034]
MHTTIGTRSDAVYSPTYLFIPKELCNISETNSHYGSVLAQLSKLKTKRTVNLVVKAQNEFDSCKYVWMPLLWRQQSVTSKRHNKDCTFGSAYMAYWDCRQDEVTSDQIGKRRRVALESLSDSLCAAVEDRAKRLKRNLENMEKHVQDLPCGDTLVVEHVIDLSDDGIEEALSSTIGNEDLNEILSQFELKAKPSTVHSVQKAALAQIMQPGDFDADMLADFRIAEKLLNHL